MADTKNITKKLGDILRERTEKAAEANEFCYFMGMLENDVIVPILYSIADYGINSYDFSDDYLYKKFEGSFKQEEFKEHLATSLHIFARDNNLTLEIKPESEHINYIFSW